MINDNILAAYFDGAITRNPGGIASYGYAIYRGSEIVRQRSGVIGAGPGMTCNVAEFSALRALLSEIRTITPKHTITIYGDNRLIIDGINKRWTFKKTPRLAALCRDCNELLQRARSIHRVSLAWIPREQNRADSVSRITGGHYAQQRG